MEEKRKNRMRVLGEKRRKSERGFERNEEGETVGMKQRSLMCVNNGAARKMSSNVH